jgi:beta-galactosidase
MWRVPYAAGVIEARGVKDGTPVTSRRETTGNAARILLRPDRVRLSANGEDVSVVEAYVVDARDRLVPTADQKIAFTASAGGRIIGVGNGNPSCHEPDHATERSAFNGLCLALVQATRTAGSIRVEATSPGLESATVVIDAVAASARPALG